MYSKGRNSRTNVNLSRSITDRKLYSQCDSKFGPHVNSSNGIIKSTSSSAHTGKSVEPLTGKPCVTLLDSNPQIISINCINKCITCVSNCSFVCTNGSNSNDYGLIPLQPHRRLVDHGYNHSLDMGYLGMHELLCKSGIPNCIGPQLKIPTDLNIPLWESLLQGNRDH